MPRLSARLIPAHAGKTRRIRVFRGRRRAHPRSRGENATHPCVSRSSPGSSPLTRGKRPVPDVHSADGRLIPAHAGKTSRSASAPGPRAAHPRSRGENSIRVHPITYGLGSSPLTRGKPSVLVSSSMMCRLIPAHAGKTTSFMGVPVAVGAHPRSRGENESAEAVACCGVGSSPLTRGKRLVCLGCVPGGRLIPAHAGKTQSTRRRFLTSRAHPRSRGENLIARARASRVTGSSPLTRGKHWLLVRRDNRARLIPAHAGKTAFGDTDPKINGAHPRSRGENALRCAADALTKGSSPLTRGKREAGVCGDPHLVAHPRSRGENPAEPQLSGHYWGSSPLTRGKPGAVMSASRTSRLIPAHAGKTRSAWTECTAFQAHPRSRGENAVALHHLVLVRGLIPAHAGKTRPPARSPSKNGAHPRSRGENA